MARSGQARGLQRYQQTQGEKLERVMLRAAHVASFIGHEPGKALFIGLYSIGSSRPMTKNVRGVALMTWRQIAEVLATCAAAATRDDERTNATRALEFLNRKQLA